MTSPCRVVIIRAAIVSLLFLSKDVSSAFFHCKDAATLSVVLEIRDLSFWSIFGQVQYGLMMP